MAIFVSAAGLDTDQMINFNSLTEGDKVIAKQYCEKTGQRDRQIDRQTDRQIYRQIDRQFIKINTWAARG